MVNIQLMCERSWDNRSGLATVEEMVGSADVIEGHGFASLDLIKGVKLREGGEKDIKDLKLTEEYFVKKDDI